MKFGHKQENPARRQAIRPSGVLALILAGLVVLAPFSSAHAKSGGSDDHSSSQSEGEGGKSGGDGPKESGRESTPPSDDGSEKDGAPSPSGATIFDQRDALEAVRSEEIIPLKLLLPRVRERYSGTVIDVSLRTLGERLVYYFKLRTDSGTVRTVYMDARTGRFVAFPFSWRP